MKMQCIQEYNRSSLEIILLPNLKNLGIAELYIYIYIYNIYVCGRVPAGLRSCNL